MKTQFALLFFFVQFVNGGPISWDWDTSESSTFKAVCTFVTDAKLEKLYQSNSVKIIEVARSNEPEHAHKCLALGTTDLYVKGQKARHFYLAIVFKGELPLEITRHGEALFTDPDLNLEIVGINEARSRAVEYAKTKIAFAEDWKTTSPWEIVDTENLWRAWEIPERNQMAAIFKNPEFDNQFVFRLFWEYADDKKGILQTSDWVYSIPLLETQVADYLQDKPFFNALKWNVKCLVGISTSTNLKLVRYGMSYREGLVTTIYSYQTDKENFFFVAAKMDAWLQGSLHFVKQIGAPLNSEVEAEAALRAYLDSPLLRSYEEHVYIYGVGWQKHVEVAFKSAVVGAIEGLYKNSNVTVPGAIALRQMGLVPDSDLKAKPTYALEGDFVEEDLSIHGFTAVVQQTKSEPFEVEVVFKSRDTTPSQDLFHEELRKFLNNRRNAHYKSCLFEAPELKAEWNHYIPPCF